MAKNIYFPEPISYTKQEIKKLFESVNEGDVHGYEHALAVYGHARKALNQIRRLWHLNTSQYMAVLLAALLHDVDDEKIFGPEHKDLPNARRILSDLRFSMTEEVLDMISYVSFNKNGIQNRYSELVYFEDSSGNIRKKKRYNIIPKWKLIPRDADRLEALGCIGVARCIGYGVQISRPLYDDNTPRLKNEWEYNKLAIRYWLDSDYQRPYSTLDYFIQGLIIRSIMSTNIEYFVKEAEKRKWPIINLLLLFSHLGYLDQRKISLITMGSNTANNIIKDFVPNYD